MSCLDDCCEEDETAAPVTQTLTWPEIPDFPVPDEPPELQVNGLEAMISLGRPSPSPRVFSSKPSLRESLAKTDFEILRGITLRESLRRGGNLWRKDPQYLETKARVALYERSRPVKHLDVFLSHSWASKGRRKVLSLLMQSGGNHALLFWLMGVLLAAGLCYANVLPMFFTYALVTENLSQDCPLGFWVMLFGFLGTFFGLMFSPYLPGCMRDMCFIDVACVHQADEALTQRGIRGISGFLAVSQELRIVWSPIYLKRLWCVFEVATYKKINPNGRVVLAPIFLETIVILLYTTILIGSLVFWLVRGGGYGGYAIIPGSVLGVLPSLITIQLLRKNCVQKHQLFADFANFDLDSVKCFSDSDRDFIHSAIAELYGSNEAFTTYVRGPLLQELLGPVMNAGPEKYGLLMISPGISMILDFTLALWKGNVPPDVVLLYVVSNGFLGLFSAFLAFKLLVLLCDFFAESGPRSVCFDCFQSCAIFLVFMLDFVLGFMLSSQPFLSNQWEVVPGIFIGYALMWILVKWLQRKCNARQISKASENSGA